MTPDVHGFAVLLLTVIALFLFTRDSIPLETSSLIVLIVLLTGFHVFPYTGQNGMLAKMVVALGELLGLWTMHPNPDIPGLWHNRLYPMVLPDSVHRRRSPLRTPKPSSGDLEASLEFCERCSRHVPPAESFIHDPVECDQEDCPMEGVIKVPRAAGKTAAAVEPPAEEEEDEMMMGYDRDALANFLKNVNR